MKIEKNIHFKYVVKLNVFQVHKLLQIFSKIFACVVAANIGKAPSSIKTNIKSSAHPYQRSWWSMRSLSSLVQSCEETQLSSRKEEEVNWQFKIKKQAPLRGMDGKPEGIENVHRKYKGRVAITSDYCPFSKPNFRAYMGILLMQTARVCSRMV